MKSVCYGKCKWGPTRWMKDWLVCSFFTKIKNAMLFFCCRVWWQDCEGKAKSELVVVDKVLKMQNGRVSLNEWVFLLVLLQPILVCWFRNWQVLWDARQGWKWGSESRLFFFLVCCLSWSGKMQGEGKVWMSEVYYLCLLCCCYVFSHDRKIIITHAVLYCLFFLTAFV